jgi:hypothetical protein
MKLLVVALETYSTFGFILEEIDIRAQWWI